MSEETKEFFTRSKIWIEDSEGNVVFGLGRLRMLEAIKKNGSIHSAAKELKIAYRAIWARIHATEERLGEKLLVRTIGGTSGGGSHLTPLAEALIEHFSKIKKCIEKETDELFKEALGEKMNLNKVKNNADI